MAIVLQGAVIISHENQKLKWKKKCEKCGWVNNSYTLQGFTHSPSVTFNSSFICPKCKNRQKVIMQGS